MCPEQGGRPRRREDRRGAFRGRQRHGDERARRYRVRRSLPEVQVPELPEDPAQVLAAIARWNLFETADLTSEDRRRVDLYQDEARRRELRQGFSDLGAYLEGLGMEAEVHPFDDFSLPRVHQLVQRNDLFGLVGP